MESEIKIKKPRKKIVLIIIIVIIIILIAFLYPYFSSTQFRKTVTKMIHGSYVYENYTCISNGETVYLKTSYDSSVADGFEGMTLYDKNHKEIDSGSSGGYSGMGGGMKNKIPYSNCVKN